LDAIREGKIEEVFDKRDNADALNAIKELDIQWVNSHSIHAEEQLSMKLRATESGQPVSGARLTVRFARTNAAPFYAQMVTDGAGEAVLVLAVESRQIKNEPYH
jgi:regulator of RNase E activity RraA